MSSLDFLDRPARQASSVNEAEHRPWPLPRRPWTMGQTWDDLLFAHWPVAPEELRRHLPDSVELDLHDGEAWLGVTPFRVSGWRLRGVPPVPWLSTFLELNVRTYVTAGGKPGIWFFSLDAASQIAVEGARLTYKLPYFRARMSATRAAGRIEYECRRVDEPDKRFRGSYGPTTDVFQARPGTLEHFLTERYCLYTTDERGLLRRADIHHRPWPLQEAEAEIERMTMQPDGISLPDTGPLLHFSRRQDVVLWPLS